MRSEITSRTNYGLQVTAIAAAGLFLVVQQDFGLIAKPELALVIQQNFTSGRGWIAMALAVIAMVVAISVILLLWWVNSRDIWRAARWMRELEHEINSRAGEHMLVWETLWGPSRMSLLCSFFSKLEPLPRSSLPPLDPSYLATK